MHSQLRYAKPGRLRTLLAEHKTPVLLIGAGASVTSGIPDAKMTVERAARWAWCKENGRLFDDPNVRPSDYQPWLARRKWFDPQISLADLYPHAIDDLLGVKRDRREFFQRLIAPGISVNRGYRSLAKILHQGWIHTVLTTNFDDCLQQAATLENQPHHIEKIKTISDLVMFSVSPPHPQLLYIHGSVEHYTDKNLKDEVRELEPQVVEKVSPLLRDHPIIVVGYRGTEPSVMEGLFLNQIGFTNNFAQGIYWCTRQAEENVELTPYVEQLATEVGSNFNSVTIDGFDNFFELDLWKQLEAQKTPPARRLAMSTLVAPSYDMQLSSAGSLEALDKVVMQMRIKQYSQALSYGLSRTDNWEVEAGEQLHLISKLNGKLIPTNGGLLLFGTNPSLVIVSSRIIVQIIGPPHWLRSTFGKEIDLSEPDADGNFQIDREITGNLWSQLDELTEILSLINTTFRLKSELSKQVQAYNSIAIKEAIVNALVHRDYERPEPICIVITTQKIKVVSPGGLIDEVRLATNNLPLEQLVKSQKRGIKGYRNPVISDLFYGGGQMDRAGSGLSDLWQQTINNNGDASFGPDIDNQFFTVELQARPEFVDEVTNTAVPKSQEIHRFAVNAIPFHKLPEKVWCATLPTFETRSLWTQKNAENLPTGYLHNGTFYTLYDLDRLTEEQPTPIQNSNIFTMSVNELCENPNGQNIFVKLLNESLFDHFHEIGMEIDYKRKRVHYSNLVYGDERKVSYQARIRKATRTVVKARRKQNGEGVAYFEHKAMEFQLMNFGVDWMLILSPGYIFTRDGVGHPIGRDRINILSTRRAAKDFNQAVHQDVSFWVAMLSEESSGIFPLRCRDSLEQFAPVLLLSSSAPTISYGADAFDYIQNDGETSLEFEDLESELIELAEQDAEDSTSDEINGRDE